MGKYNLTPLTKILLVAAVLGIAYFFAPKSWFGGSKEKITQNIDKVDLPTAPGNAQATVIPFEIPKEQLFTSQVKSKVSIMAWNSQMGWILSNGGSKTKEGSLMAKNGVYMDILRQDDCNQMQAEMLSAANDYKNNNSAPGYFCAVMGDGAAAFLASVNKNLEKLGTEYRAKIIYSAGRSLGEDKYMALPEVKNDAQKARGSVVAAYLKDGDWNIVVNWASNNNIPVNHDEKTYDPDAINFYAANDFIDAAQKYNSHYKETRKNKKTGKDIGVEINGVATWTPGDEMIVNGRGGLVNIASTKEYAAQMPNVIIGIDKWMQDHRSYVENMIKSIGQGGDQIKSYSQALDLAGKYSAEVYKEQDSKYWVTYYKGETKADKMGNVVDLGGSRVHNIGDNVELFGLNPGSDNVYGVVYKIFGDIVKEAYPEDVPSYPSIEEALDLSYLKNVINTIGKDKISTADKTIFTNDQIRNTIARKNWTIEFASGSSNFTNDAQKELEKLYGELTVGSNLKIEIHGHTDNTGNADANKTLSESRAFAIKQWLQNRNSSSFPENRITIFAHGQDNPLVPNSNKANMAKNRRVEIVMGE